MFHVAVVSAAVVVRTEVYTLFLFYMAILNWYIVKYLCTRHPDFLYTQTREFQTALRRSAHYETTAPQYLRPAGPRLIMWQHMDIYNF